MNIAYNKKYTTIVHLNIIKAHITVSLGKKIYWPTFNIRLTTDRLQYIREQYT